MRPVNMVKTLTGTRNESTLGKVVLFQLLIITSQLIKKKEIIISRENHVFLLHLILYCIFYNACYFRRTFLTNKTELLLSWSLLFRNKSWKWLGAVFSRETNSEYFLHEKIGIYRFKYCQYLPLKTTMSDYLFVHLPFLFRYSEFVSRENTAPNHPTQKQS
jgi:hypothetical protein